MGDNGFACMRWLVKDRDENGRCLVSFARFKRQKSLAAEFDLQTHLFLRHPFVVKKIDRDRNGRCWVAFTRFKGLKFSRRMWVMLGDIGIDFASQESSLADEYGL